MDFSTVDLDLATSLLLLLLIGMGPKVALVPFLEMTKSLPPEKQRQVGKRMVKTGVITALVLFFAGALLMRLLHISEGAVSVAGGIVLLILALQMALGIGKKEHEGRSEEEQDFDKLAVYPLAIPYLLNPVGIVVLIIASAHADNLQASALVIGLILVVGLNDYLVFGFIDKIAKRMRPTTLVISEVVFGILLTALAVELMVRGLAVLGVIEAVAGHH